MSAMQVSTSLETIDSNRIPDFESRVSLLTVMHVYRNFPLHMQGMALHICITALPDPHLFLFASIAHSKAHTLRLGL